MVNDSQLSRFDDKAKLFLKLLENGERVSANDAISKLKCSKSIFYGIVFRLRKKVDIKSKDGFYFLKSANTGRSVVSNNQVTNITNNHSNYEKLNELKELSDSELDDYLINVRQSVFYSLSAKAVIEASKFARNLKHQVISGI